jgi:hypothetical protein
LIFLRIASSAAAVGEDARGAPQRCRIATIDAA